MKSTQTDAMRAAQAKRSTGATLTACRRWAMQDKYRRKDARTFCLLKAFGRGAKQGNLRDANHPAAAITEGTADKFRASLRLTGWDKETKAKVLDAFKARVKAAKETKKRTAAMEQSITPEAA